MRLLTFIVIASFPLVAIAQQPTAPVEPALTLRSGAVYHGRIVDALPGDHVMLELPTGARLRFEWAELADPSQAVPSHDDDASAATGVRVHLDADDPRAALFRRNLDPRLAGDGDGDSVIVPTEQLDEVCGVPCDTTVDPRATYRVAGEGLTPSSPLAFAPTDGDVAMFAKTGSLRARTSGAVLTMSGIGLVGVGAALLALPALESTDAWLPPNVDAAAQSTHEAEWTTGGIVAGIGVTALVAGALLWATSNTSIRVDDGDGPRAQLGSSLALTAGGVRF